MIVWRGGVTAIFQGNPTKSLITLSTASHIYCDCIPLNVEEAIQIIRYHEIIRFACYGPSDSIISFQLVIQEAKLCIHKCSIQVHRIALLKSLTKD